jgi:hypothetical protein
MEGPNHGVAIIYVGLPNLGLGHELSDVREATW